MCIKLLYVTHTRIVSINNEKICIKNIELQKTQSSHSSTESFNENVVLLLLVIFGVVDVFLLNRFLLHPSPVAIAAFLE